VAQPWGIRPSHADVHPTPATQAERWHPSASSYACPEMEDGLAPATQAPSPRGARRDSKRASERDDRVGVCTSSLDWGWTSKPWSGCGRRLRQGTWRRLLSGAGRPPTAPGAPPGAVHATKRLGAAWEAERPDAGLDAGLVETGVACWPRSMCCCQHLHQPWACGPGFEPSRS